LGPSSHGEAMHRRRLPQLSPSQLSQSPSAHGCWPGGPVVQHGMPGGMQPLPSLRTSNNLRPEMLLARTHGGFSARSSSASTLYAEPLRGGGDVRRGRGVASDAGSAAGSHGRFYATAPAGRIGAAEVQEATGVRLSDTQLSVLRRRYQGGGGAFGGDAPSSADLRQAVFGSIVLRPGQFARAIPESRAETPGSTTHLSRLTCSSVGAGRASASQQQYHPGGQPGRLPGSSKPATQT